MRRDPPSTLVMETLTTWLTGEASPLFTRMWICISSTKNEVLRVLIRFIQDILGCKMYGHTRLYNQYEPHFRMVFMLKNICVSSEHPRVLA